MKKYSFVRIILIVAILFSWNNVVFAGIGGDFNIGGGSSGGVYYAMSRHLHSFLMMSVG